MKKTLKRSICIILSILLILSLIFMVFSALWHRSKSHESLLAMEQKDIVKIELLNCSEGVQVALEKPEDIDRIYTAFAGKEKNALYYCYDTDIYRGELLIGDSGYKITFHLKDGSVKELHVNNHHIEVPVIHRVKSTRLFEVTKYYYSPQSNFDLLNELTR